MAKEINKKLQKSEKMNKILHSDKHRVSFGDLLTDAIVPPGVALSRQVNRQNQSVLPSRVCNFADIVAGGHFGKHNVIISGGDHQARSTATKLLVERAMGRGVAVFIVHCGNPYYSQMIKTPVYIPEKGHGIFSPFSSIGNDNAALLLTKIGSSTMNIPNIIGLWKLVTELAALEEGRMSLKALMKIPIFDLQNYILESHKIPSNRQMEFINLYSRVAEKVDDAQLLLSYLSDLPLGNPFNYPEYSMEDIVDGGGIVSIDIVSDSNRLYKEICFAELEQLMRNGKQFVLVLDNIKFLGIENSYTDMVMLQNNNKTTLIYTSDDVHVSLKAKPELFQTMVGGVSSVVVLRHNSAQSAIQWEEYFGKYYHMSVEMNTSHSKESFRFFSQTQTSGMTSKQELRSLVPAKMINEQGANRAIVKTADGETWLSSI